MSEIKTDPESSTRTRVFLSYASSDYAIAVEIKSTLQSFGVDVFDDRTLQAGSPWTSQLESALQSVNVVAVLISSSFVKSAHVTREWTVALAQHKPVIPITVESGVQAPALLASYVGIDISDPHSRSEKLGQLAQQVSHSIALSYDTQAEAIESAERVLSESRARWLAELTSHSEKASVELTYRRAVTAGLALFLIVGLAGLAVIGLTTGGDPAFFLLPAVTGVIGLLTGWATSRSHFTGNSQSGADSGDRDEAQP